MILLIELIPVSIRVPSLDTSQPASISSYTSYPQSSLLSYSPILLIILSPSFAPPCTPSCTSYIPSYRWSTWSEFESSMIYRLSLYDSPVSSFHSSRDPRTWASLAPNRNPSLSYISSYIPFMILLFESIPVSVRVPSLGTSPNPVSHETQNTMIHRVASRLVHSIRPINIPPHSIIDPDIEFHKHITKQIERLQEAITWNDDLADEFDKIESEVEIIWAVFDDETFPHEVLHIMISELMEWIPSLIERNERL